MANGAGRLFNIIKNTSEGTNPVPTQLVSLKVKSTNPIIFNKDDKIDITEEFCIFNDNINVNSLAIGDVVLAFVFNEGQLYFIEQTDNQNANTFNYNNVTNKPKINNVELSGNKTSEDLGIQTENQIKQLIEDYILEDNKKKYPVGKIIMETENVNPATYLGFGTWQQWGAGRVPVGVDTTDTDFDTVEEIGGSKVTDKFYLNGLNYGGLQGGNSGGEYRGRVWVSPSNLVNTGGSAGNYPQSIVQPYITCYMWKRIS